MSWKKGALVISLALWCLLAILPFASRTHYLPLPQWWGEMESVWLTLGLITFGAFAQWPQQWLPRASVWCLLLAGVWVVQPWLVAMLFPGLNYTVAMAWVVLALLAIGTTILRTQLGNIVLTVWLARALMVGALLQSLIGFTQLTGLALQTDGLIFYDIDHPTTNVFGHIGQRNQFSHYLLWGVLAGVYLQGRGRLKSVPFVLWTAWLALLLAFAGSRAVILYIVATTVLASIWHIRIRSVASRRLLTGMLTASVVITGWQLLLPFINYLAGLLWHSDIVLASGIERLAANNDEMASRRLVEMHKAWLVFQTHPWWGVGWSQFAAQSVKLQILPIFANAGFNSGLFTHAHNLILQLLAEMGGVITVLILLGFIWVILPFFRKPAELEGFLPLACLSVSLIHSMLEYPLWYLYFLSMLVIFATLAPHRGYRLAPKPRLFFTGAWGALVVFSLAAVPFYWELLRLYHPSGDPVADAKRQQQLIAIIQHHPLYAFHALYTLDNYLTSSAADCADKYRWIEILAAIRPYPDVLLKKAQLEARLGESAKAVQTMKVALASFPTYTDAFVGALTSGPAVWRPLEEIARQALQRLPDKYWRQSS